MSKPKILIFDIETAPIETYAWGLGEQHITLEFLKEDWSILSWSAKWLDSPDSKIMYADQRNQKNVRNDKKIVKQLRDLLDEADVVITQNGKSFDSKKINARIEKHRIKQPSSYRHIDIYIEGKKHFKFTSHKLAYMAEFLGVKYKKQEHKEYPGFSMWKACLVKDKNAFKVMEKYNKYDILATQEVYKRIAPWEKSINFDVYSDTLENVCSCGSKQVTPKGYAYTRYGKFQRFICNKCGKQSQSRTNMLSKEKRKSLKA